MKLKVKSKSPLKQESKPTPTYSNLPTMKKKGSETLSYIATVKDSTDYREGFYGGNVISLNRMKNRGRIERYSKPGSKPMAPFRQELTGTKPTPAEAARQKRAELVAATKIKRQETTRKNDSIVQRCANAKNMDLGEYRNWSAKNSKQEDAGQSNLAGGKDEKDSGCSKNPTKGDSTKRLR